MAKKGSGSMKQNTLFSFFKKKESPTKPTPTPTPAATGKPKQSDATSLPIATTSSISTKSTIGKRLESKPTSKNGVDVSRFDHIQVGTRLSVYWPDDDCYYDARVTARHATKAATNSLSVKILYDDGEIETIDLSREKFKVLNSDVGGKRSKDQDIVEEEMEMKSTTRESRPKKLRISDDSDEENEFMDDESSDFSPAGEETEEEYEGEESMMITDEDDDEVANNSKPSSKQSSKVSGQKRFRVTPLQTVTQDSNHSEERPKKKSCKASSGVPSFITPPAGNKNTSSFRQQGAPPQNLFASFTQSTSKKAKPQEVTPPSSGVTSSATSSSLSTPSPISKQPAKIPLPTDKVVNLAGTHYHNHFTFLRPDKRRDNQKRPMNHPDYNPRTLYVDYNEMERVMRHTNTKVSPGAKQWWELKSQYADTLLLFKTGKFYEIFHMDADVAAKELGFVYMKGAVAHVGFPEIAYGGFCERLVKAGHKVARVEQTETPEMLKERKKNIKRGAKKPSVVNREVCSIVTSGTRTFCYMDDLKSLENEGCGGSIGPLLAIKEVILSGPEKEDGNDEVVPVCEYGVTLIDAVRGVVTLGQFADDMLRTRMHTLLTTHSPCEILIEGGSVSKTLMSLIKSVKNTFLPSVRVEVVNVKETFPASTAIDKESRIRIERPNPNIRPWDVKETIVELHRKQYYPRSSRKNEHDGSNLEGGIGRWPEVLQACIKGGANLALSAFGASLFYLQRNLIDEDIISMGQVKAYCPSDDISTPELDDCDEQRQGDETVAVNTLRRLAKKEQSLEDGIDANETSKQLQQLPCYDQNIASEASIDHLCLDGVTIANLDILANSHTNTTAGSLWSKINHTKSPHGSRILKAWLLRPLFAKNEIDRRADAVSELTSGRAADAMSEARAALGKCGDIERLLSRVHSMGGNGSKEAVGSHPNERAVLYETQTHTRRKVEDFSKLLDGLRSASAIPEMFEGVEIQSALLSKIVRTTDNGGYFPSGLTAQLDWFYDNFDVNLAKKGLYEPNRGVDDDYDHACDEIERIKGYLDEYKDEMCSNVLPSGARSLWKYANLKEDSKDKYLIELPISIEVPSDFILKGKRGSKQKQINKYRTPVVEELVQQLEAAIEMKKDGKARGIKLVFSKFDRNRSLWSSVSQSTAMLDALGSLAEVSSRPGYSRPKIADCSSADRGPRISVRQGVHPCVDQTHSGEDFIPNDLCLGEQDYDSSDKSRVLLLSGPNMGGKSTLLRQTCCIAILAQMGCFVPAEECTLTPFDRIFTRLGASDRILLGQSTFFVELAETAAALRGATRRSLVIMDELGRGTSTFDGTAIASATVKHLVERNGCLTLFATHYHSLLDEWKCQPSVRLGHMECLVEERDEDDPDTPNCNTEQDNVITFLYTLGEGACPRSFGINVARLAGLPEQVLTKAKQISASFEASMNTSANMIESSSDQQAKSHLQRLKAAVASKDMELAQELWEEMQSYY